MINNGMLLSPDLHRMLTLTLAEKLERRDINAEARSGRIDRQRMEQIRRTALVDAEHVVRDAVETLARLTGPEPVHAGKPSLAQLIAAMK